MTTFLSARYYSVSVQQPPVYNDHVLVVPKVAVIYRFDCIQVTDILKFYEVLFCAYHKGLFCLLKTVVRLIFLCIFIKHS